MSAALIFAVTLLVSLLGLWAAPAIIARNLFRPFWFLPQRQYWTAITSGFVHADLAHLLFNSVTYWFFAFPLQRVIGAPRFLALYLIGLAASNIGTYIKHRRDPDYACLGASGAILAVLFASIVYFPRQSIMILPIPVPIPARSATWPIPSTPRASSAGALITTRISTARWPASRSSP